MIYQKKIVYNMVIGMYRLNYSSTLNYATKKLLKNKNNMKAHKLT